MPKMRRGSGSGAVSVTAESGNCASRASPCSSMLSTMPGSPASISASMLGPEQRSARRIEGWARSTTMSFAPLPAPSSTPARTKPFSLKLTNFMRPSRSGDAELVDHAAVDFDAEAGAGRHGDGALDLADRFDGEMVAERIFLLFE